MTGWTSKMFWKTVTIEKGNAGYGLCLDGLPMRTPGRSRLEVPNLAFAEAIAEEWEAQEDTIDPTSMHATRMANSAIEKVAPQRNEVIAHLASYGTSDLLCYRADQPAGLAKRQQAAWDPWLDWAAERYGARLSVTSGILPVDQPPEALANLGEALEEFDSFELAAVHELVCLPGSLILGLAAAEGAEAADILWNIGRLDELWQIEQWGQDDEAEAVNAAREADFLRSARFLDLLRQK